MTRNKLSGRPEGRATLNLYAAAPEQWRPVVGYEGRYQVSDHGRVRSLARTVPTRNGRTTRVHQRILSPAPNSSGYLRVWLYRDKVSEQKFVHQLVADAFLGPRPAGMEVRHRNGNKVDNRATNLEHGTRSDNMLDAVRHGTHRNTRKDACPRGHLLAPWNLVPAQKRRGKRECLACETAYNKLRRTVAKPLEDPRFVGMADANYARLQNREVAA